MLGALRRWFIPKPPEAVHATYIALVAAARNPFFYGQLGVPDTLDGRFEMIVLHLFLLQHRLVTHGTPANEAFAQFLSEAFFYDMDCNLRELGVADTGVAHRIKKMGKAYHGRLQAYAASMADETALYSALVRNLYGTVEQGDVAVLRRLAGYVKHMSARLAATEEAAILDGTFQWPDVAMLGL